LKYKKDPNDVTDEDKLFLFNTLNEIKFFKDLKKDILPEDKKLYILSMISKMELEVFNYGDPVITYGYIYFNQTI